MRNIPIYFYVAISLLLGIRQIYAIDQDSEVDVNKIKPQVRAAELSSTLYIIAGSSIYNKLANIVEVSKEALLQLPTVVAGHNTPSATLYSKILVKGLKKDGPNNYSIIKAVRPVNDPISKNLLGYIGEIVGEAKLVRFEKNVSLLEITNTKEAIIAGMIVVPKNELSIPKAIEIKAASNPAIQGIITSVPPSSYNKAFLGVNDLVLINIGKKQGVNPWEMLYVYRTLDAAVELKNVDHKVAQENIGEIVPYLVFDNFSVAIITKSNDFIKVNNLIKSAIV